jgi:hypothetical protein
VVATFARHRVTGEPMQFALDQRHETMKGLFVTLTPSDQEVGDVASTGRRPGSLGHWTCRANFIPLPALPDS